MLRSFYREKIPLPLSYSHIKRAPTVRPEGRIWCSRDLGARFRLTVRLTDPAKMTVGLKPSRNRGARCSPVVGRVVKFSHCAGVQSFLESRRAVGIHKILHGKSREHETQNHCDRENRSSPKV